MGVGEGRILGGCKHSAYFLPECSIGISENLPE